MSAWAWQLILGGVSSAVFAIIGSMIFHKWLKRERIPDDLTELKAKIEVLEGCQKEFKQFSKDLVAVRGQVKYLEGRINGKHWRTE